MRHVGIRYSRPCHGGVKALITNTAYLRKRLDLTNEPRGRVEFRLICHFYDSLQPQQAEAERGVAIGVSHCTTAVMAAHFYRSVVSPLVLSLSASGRGCVAFMVSNSSGGKGRELCRMAV